MRMVPAEAHFNGLTPVEHERLCVLLEECGEVIQIGNKILRHGYESDNRGKLLEPNRRTLIRELGDVLAAIGQMVHAEDIDEMQLWGDSQAKTDSERYQQHMHHHQIIRKQFGGPAPRS